MTGLKINNCDLVYQFDFVDAIQVQQILIALKNGYELKDIFSARGAVEFTFSKKGLNNANDETSCA